MNALFSPRLHLIVGAFALPLFVGGCNSSSSGPAPATTIGTGPVGGTVLTAWGDPLAAAVVYLVPADAISTVPIGAADVLSGGSEPHDEPLEDLLRSDEAANFPQATTDAAGGFKIDTVDTNASYFPYVAVESAEPSDVLPGGNLSRVALTGDALTMLDIEVSGTPTAAATYLGSSTCLLCHRDYSSQKVHAHRLGFRAPGSSTQLQDLSRVPDFDDGITYFVEAASADQGTPLWYHSYDGGRGFDKFRVAQTDPGNAEIQVFLWREAGDYKITMRNLVPGANDPDRTYTVDLTYGGALFKQRYMVKVDDPGYAGRYPFLQYQHAGDDALYDRTRNQWRDYHMDFFWDAATQTFKLPNKSKTIESNCMACHSTGYEYFDNAATGERLCDAVNDPAGDLDIDGDGTLDELNTGCEVCHGPGSEHAGLLSPRSIVKPSLLAPERENMICGRCHDRVAGNDDRHNDQPLNAQGEMAPPGIGRDEYLTDYTSRKGPKLSSFWQDELHSKSHHQQYSDFIKSAHYRNSERLMVCSDCHDLHGKGAYDGELKGDPHSGELCAQCHAIDIREHVGEYTGSIKAGRDLQCTQCHYYKTAKTGAGGVGLRMGMPTGASTDSLITYFENDISSHLTTVPFSNNVGVVGQVPGKAMPIPFVNDCATCHNAQNLQFR